MSLFSPLSHSFLGFDPLFDEVDRLLALAKTQSTSVGYPPLNVYKEPDDGYSIELAVAGFKKDDIRIEHDKKNGLITISGDNTVRPQVTANVVRAGKISSRSDVAEVPKNEMAPTRQVIRQGIANRSFTRSFTVADDLLVEGATLEDGLLTVKLKKLDLPENKPQLIPIA